MRSPDLRRVADDALSRLRALDTRLHARTPQGLSLAPGRARPSALADVAAPLVATAREDDADAIDALASALIAVTEAVHENFPENLFFDVDYLAANLWHAAPAPGATRAETLRESATLVTALQRDYGRHTAIRFRYVHDFLYGFDWAKWVRRDPSARAGVRPFDLEFLRYSRTRAGELLELIARDDVRYPKLSDGCPRNPFGFSREPPDEAALFRELAREGIVPLEAWRVDARPEWDRPFHDLRAERAARLGIVLPPPR